MKEIIIDTIKDNLKLLPFLFLTFLFLEYLEHRVSNKSKKKLEKSGRFGPFIGGLIGAFPQCGFGVAATNIYVARIITIGTLISVYLSTSDEMLPILLSEGTNIGVIIKLITLKVVIGIIWGIIIDFIFRSKIEKNNIHDICEEDHCDCEHGIFKSSIKHTLNIALFIFIISFILNIIMEYYGMEKLEHIFLNNNILGSFVSSLIGLIPNCGASVVITELYLNNLLSLGSAMAGLLTGSGVALLVLFKTNHNLKDNIKIVSLVYILGVISGIIIDLIGLTI